METAPLRGIVVGDAGTRRTGNTASVMPPGADLLRPLAEYEQVAGGRW